MPRCHRSHFLVYHFNILQFAKAHRAFCLATPRHLHDVEDGNQDPRATYANPADWEVKAKDLAKRFVDNFVKFTDNDEGKALVAAGPEL